MPSNSSGWFFHCLARETNMLGHLFSPKAQRGPWPWFPYALDNGAFACWQRGSGKFDFEKWKRTEEDWHKLIFWADSQHQKPIWAIVPDVPGNREQTLERWYEYQHMVRFKKAIAVQDGMTPEDVLALDPVPEVIAIGGTTEWKWESVPMWDEAFSHVHVLRCNSPTKLEWMRQFRNVKSCDGTGWNRGDRVKTRGLEEYCHRYKNASIRKHHWMTPYVSRKVCEKQLTFDR